MIPYFTLAEVWILGVRVNMWGLMVGVGLLVSLYIIRSRARAASISARRAFDLGLWLFLGAIIGGRLGFVALYEFPYFAEYPEQVFALWNGGLSSIGGIAGAVAVFFIATHHDRRNRMRFADVLSYAFPFGWAIGRLGCFFIHDHPGTLSSSLLAVQFPGGARFDMGLMESLGTVLIAIAIFFIARRPRLRGIMTSVVAISYGLLRFLLDFLRPWVGEFAETRYSGLTPAQYGSLVLIAVGIGIWLGRGTEVDADRHGAGVV